MPRKAAATRPMAVAPIAISRIRVPLVSVGSKSSSVLRNATVSVTAPIRISNTAKASAALPRPAIKCGTAQLRVDSALVSGVVLAFMVWPLFLSVLLWKRFLQLAFCQGVEAQLRCDGRVIAPDLVKPSASLLQ